MNPATCAVNMRVSLIAHLRFVCRVVLLSTLCFAAFPAKADLVDIEFAELPVADAFSLVSRQAKLDLQIDPTLDNAKERPDKISWGPPTLQLKLKQVSADQVLESMAGAYGLVIDRSSLGRNFAKLRFAEKQELLFKRAAKLMPNPEKNLRTEPLLMFDEAPVLQVIEILAAQSQRNLLQSLELQIGKNPQGMPWRDVFISFKIRNVTPQQALEAVLDASGLVVDWSPLGQVGVIYPASRFGKLAEASTDKLNAKAEKTDFVLADLELEDFIKLTATQLKVNWMVSTAARQTTIGADKQPLMQSPISISQKGITPLEALQEVLKGKGLEFKWNERTEVGVIDLVSPK